MSANTTQVRWDETGQPVCDWQYELSHGLAELDWRALGDRFVSEILRSVAASTGATGNSKSERRFDPDRRGRRDRQIALTLSECSLTSSLYLVVLKDKHFAAMVIGAGTEQNDQITPWAKALAEALDDLTKDEAEHDWWAILDRQQYRTPRFISRPMSVGSLTLRSCPYLVEEPVPGSREMILATIRRWNPVRVEGSSRGFTTAVGMTSATRDLCRLCALLTVADVDDTAWTLRQSPRPAGWEPRELDRSSLRIAQEESASRDELAFPDWMSEAWVDLSKDAGLDRLVDGYYEGCLLERTHPSYSLVAFTSVSEKIGERLFETPRVENCANCEKPLANSRVQLLEKAFARVMSRKEARRLKEDVYRPRSITAHSGRTLGLESYFGSINTLQTASPVYDLHSFGFTVFRAKEAARKLLTGLLDRTLEPLAESPT